NNWYAGQAGRGFVDVVGGFGHGQHDTQQAAVVVRAIEFVGNVFGQFGDVFFPPWAPVAVNANPTGVYRGEPANNIFAGEALIFWCHSVFDVIEHNIGGGIYRGGTTSWLRSVDESPRAGKIGLDLLAR